MSNNICNTINETNKKHPLLIKMENMIKMAEKSNEYYYNSMMTDIKAEIIKRKKQKQSLIKIKENERKYKEKVNEMNELKEQSIDNKLKKILNKPQNYLAYITEIQKEKKKRHYTPIHTVNNHYEISKKIEYNFCKETEDKINKT